MFNGDPTLRGAGETFQYTQEMIREIIRCKEDILYFAEKYFYIMTIDKGKMLIPLWDFQKKLLKAMVNTPNNKRHLCILSARQMSKTTISTIYILHSALFGRDENFAILANREAMAIDILGRIQMSYSLLPLWMQRGVIEWNRKTFALENGVKLIAQATSGNACRGMVISLLFLDECSFVADHIWEEFYSSVYPSISSGERSKIIMVSTPNGLNHFYDIYKKAVVGDNDYYPVKIPWSAHPKRNEKWKQDMIKDCGLARFEVEFGCKFAGSSSQLIDSDKLEALQPIEPIDISHYSGALQIYEHPQEGCKYVLGVDPSKGTGQDYAVIQVLKITNKIELEQVAIFRANYIKVDNFVDIIMGISDLYNECDVMVENNDEAGGIVVKQLYEDKSFERLINCDKKGYGIRATKKSKFEGNMLLKKYMDSDYLKIHDKRTIYELSRYVEITPNVYHAEGRNEHDDCVSALIWAVYYISTEFYDDSHTGKKNDGSEEDMFSNFAILGNSVVGRGFEDYNLGHDLGFDEFGNGVGSFNF